MITLLKLLKDLLQNLLWILSKKTSLYLKIFRKLNEDKLNINLNLKIKNPEKENKFLSVNYFSIFDGHGGEAVAEELKENLHKYIFESNEFFYNPTNAILNAFKTIELKILKKIIKNKTPTPEKSGSCALCAIILSIQKLIYFQMIFAI